MHINKRLWPIFLPHCLLQLAFLLLIVASYTAFSITFSGWSWIGITLCAIGTVCAIAFISEIIIDCDELLKLKPIPTSIKLERSPSGKTLVSLVEADQSDSSPRPHVSYTAIDPCKRSLQTLALGRHELLIYMDRSRFTTLILSTTNTDEELIVLVPSVRMQDDPLTVAQMRQQQASFLSEVDPGLAIKACEAALQDAPGDWQAMVTKSLVLIDQKNYGPALELLNQLDSPGLLDRERALVLLLRAWCQVSLGDWKDASESLRISMTIYPDDDEWTSLRSYVADQITRVSHGRTTDQVEVPTKQSENWLGRAVAYGYATVLDTLSLTESSPLMFTRSRYIATGLMTLSATIPAAMIEMVFIAHKNWDYAVMYCLAYITMMVVSLLSAHICCRLMGGRGALVNSFIVYLWTMSAALLLSAWCAPSGPVISWVLALLFCTGHLQRSHKLKAGQVVVAAASPLLAMCAIIIAFFVWVTMTP